jgi:hypothetical protein
MDFSLELGTEVLRQTRLAPQAMLGLVRRLDRATLAALVRNRKDDLATGAHTVFSEVTLHSSSQRRLFTT